MTAKKAEMKKIKYNETHRFMYSESTYSEQEEKNYVDVQ